MRKAWDEVLLWVRRHRRLAAGCALAALALLGVLVWRDAADRAARSSADDGSEVVQIQPFATTLNVVGAITAGDRVDVTAPFDGVVRSMTFDYGAGVAKGQVLLRLDDSELRQRRDEGDAEVLRTSQASAELANWTSGPEVSQARRTVSQTTLDLGETDRKITETKNLLDRGLVARGEYDALIEQRRSQQMAAEAARQDLQATLARGQGANRQIAALELSNAHARLAELDRELGGATVVAPVAGVIVRPTGEKTETAAAIHPGATLSRGQLIGTIAPAGGLAVSFELSEADANRVRAGQSVTVTGPGFAPNVLGGVVASVARQSSVGSGAGETAATFAAVARLAPLTPAQADTVRVGMTADVAVATYANPRALVVPPAAILGSSPDTAVMVRDARTHRPARVSVTIGHVSPDGVEVLSGLRAGDVVLWSKSAQAHASDDDD